MEDVYKKFPSGDCSYEELARYVLAMVAINSIPNEPRNILPHDDELA